MLIETIAGNVKDLFVALWGGIRGGVKKARERDRLLTHGKGDPPLEKGKRKEEGPFKTNS